MPKRWIPIDRLFDACSQEEEDSGYALLMSSMPEPRRVVDDDAVQKRRHKNAVYQQAYRDRAKANGTD